MNDKDVEVRIGEDEEKGLLRAEHPDVIAKTQMTALMDLIEDTQLRMEEMKLENKNRQIQLVRMAKRFPAVAKAIGAPTEIPKRGGSTTASEAPNGGTPGA